MGLFGRNKHLPIALDLGSQTIRMMQLQCVADTIRVAAACSWRYPASLPTDPAERQAAAIEAVRSMRHSGGFKGRRVITSLSCGQLQIKNVRLPKMSSAKLDEAIRTEASRRYDFAVTSNPLNYLNAGEVRNGNESQHEIIMMAVPPDVIDQHVSMVSAMGLAPEHIDAEPVALFRVFEQFLRRQNDVKAVTVVVDVGHGSTRVVVSRGRDIVFIKAIDIGGKKLTEAVARHANLDNEEAGELRMRSSRQLAQTDAQDDERQGDSDSRPERSSVDWTIRDALRSDVEALAREVGLCLRYCSVSFRGLRPQEVYLTGGEACDVTFVEMFREQLNMECSISDPLRGIDAAGVDMGVHRGGRPAEWALCTGLAVHMVDMSDFGQEDDHESRRLSA